MPEQDPITMVDLGIDWSKARWRKSSNSADGGCVEVARCGDRIGVRDTKQAGAGPILVFNEREWDAFLIGVASHEFDLRTLED